MGRGVGWCKDHVGVTLSERADRAFADQRVLITWIIIGLIAGYVANLILRGRRMNPIFTILIGVLGAFVGNFIFSLLQIQESPDLLTGINIRWIDLITALVGAMIVLVIFLSIFRHR